MLEQLEQELASLREPGADGQYSKRSHALLTTERYARYVRQTRQGVLNIDRTVLAAEQELDGKWAITSNDDTLSAQNLALGFRQLMRVDECWRMMKSGLRTRPVFNWRPHRISAHIWLGVLALLLERMAESRTAEAWRTIVAHADRIKVIEVTRLDRGSRS